jgi:hypothetical protein
MRVQKIRSMSALLATAGSSVELAIAREIEREEKGRSTEEPDPVKLLLEAIDNDNP